MKKTWFFIFALILAGNPSASAADKIRVVATTTTFADLVKTVAGGEAEIYTIASPRHDIHFLTPTPRAVLKVKKADVFVHGGLDLELWRDPLLEAAGRMDFLQKGGRAVDLSQGVEILEVPASLSRAQGDMHQHGNPHYWLDPDNGRIMAATLSAAFSKLYPERAPLFQANLEKFQAALDLKIADWEKRMVPFKGLAFISCHHCWPYFARKFELHVAGQLEPFPGIPPTAKHLAKMLEVVRAQNVGFLINEIYRSPKPAQRVARDTGTPVLPLAQAVGENSEVQDYAGLFEYNIRLIEEAMRKKGATS